MSINTEKFQSASASTVGEWDGQEHLAAANFNRICDAIARAETADFMATESENYFDDGVDADEHDALNFREDRILERCQLAWDHWGSDEKLLSVTDEEIQEYAA